MVVDVVDAVVDRNLNLPFEGTSQPACAEASCGIGTLKSAAEGPSQARNLVSVSCGVFCLGLQRLGLLRDCSASGFLQAFGRGLGCTESSALGVVESWRLGHNQEITTISFKAAHREQRTGRTVSNSQQLNESDAASRITQVPHINNKTSAPSASYQ